MKAAKARRGAARLLAFAALILIGFAPVQRALAHASLISSQPEDGAVLRESPERFILIFNEPVAPLRLQLIDRGGQATPLTEIVQHNMTLIVRPPRGALDQGTHAPSWRVVSSDGHPVGGTLIFSVGQPDATTPIRETKSDPLLKTMIWLVQIALFIALLLGLGGAVFANWSPQRGPCRNARKNYSALYAPPDWSQPQYRSDCKGSTRWNCHSRHWDGRMYGKPVSAPPMAPLRFWPSWPWRRRGCP